MKDTFVAYIRPSDGVIADVILMDRDFNIKIGQKDTGVTNGLRISNLTRYVHITHSASVTELVFPQLFPSQLPTFVTSRYYIQLDIITMIVTISHKYMHITATLIPLLRVCHNYKNVTCMSQIYVCHNYVYVIITGMSQLRVCHKYVTVVSVLFSDICP